MNDGVGLNKQAEEGVQVDCLPTGGRVTFHLFWEPFGTLGNSFVTYESVTNFTKTSQSHHDPIITNHESHITNPVTLHFPSNKITNGNGENPQEGAARPKTVGRMETGGKSVDPPPGSCGHP